VTTEYSACVIVGLPFDDLFKKDESKDHLLDNQDLVCCTFSGFTKPLVGIIVDRSGSFSYNQLDLETLNLACEIAKNNFKKLTGLDAKTYLVWIVSK
jgi:flagellar hook-associated protein FlgK